MKINKLCGFLLLTALLLVACAKKTNKPVIQTYLVEENERPRQIIISLQITNYKNEISAKITESKIVTTPKKVEQKKSNNWKENDFVCFVMDDNKNINDTILIVQPLNPRYETPNDDGTINSSIIEIKNNDVMLRFPYTHKTKYLRIDKVEKDKKLKTINTITIPTNQ